MGVAHVCLQSDALRLLVLRWELIFIIGLANADFRMAGMAHHDFVFLPKKAWSLKGGVISF